MTRGLSVESLTRAPSVEWVIAPQSGEVAPEVVAECRDLAREAPPQLEHQPLVRRLGLPVDELTPRQPQRGGAQLARRDRLDRRLRGPRDRSAADREHPDELVELLRAHAFVGDVGVEHIERRRVVYAENLAYPPQRRLVVGTKVVVDQDQHL